MKSNSAISQLYKKNLVQCLVERAHKINSSVQSFNKEILKLKRFFCQNGFNLAWISKLIAAKIDNIQNNGIKSPTAAKKVLYCKFPFMSRWHNNQFRAAVNEIIASFYPQIDLRVIFSNRHTISSMFPFKDTVPRKLRSNVVYKYTCGMCNSIYIGETTRHFYTRCMEHQGYSPRTGTAYRNPPNSNIYRHQQEKGHPILPENFEILLTTDSYNLEIAESIQIHCLRPNLNVNISSVPLNVLA